MRIDPRLQDSELHKVPVCECRLTSAFAYMNGAFHGLVLLSTGLSGIRQIYLQWEEPNEDFEAFVSSTLKRKIFKYVQDDHPRRISKEDADSLYKRIMVEIIDIERKAFNEHEKNNTRRPIDGWKLESNIKEHVKSRVYRLHARSYSQGRPRHF